VVDDLPWPELGNVSRGATRGNQGQKGAMSRPDHDGRCLLQLRVQPGVLTVLLNRKASDWYRILDNEVNQALKLTKTYWRKARRRQDYDAQADQEHMELHEWLQQLKDKVMSHLELLMQRGDIKGPPFTMPDDIELTFLCKFIERQQAGIPHNPRLREAFLQGRLAMPSRSVVPSSRSLSDEPNTHGSDSGWAALEPCVDASQSYSLPPVASMSCPPSQARAIVRVGVGMSIEEDLTTSAQRLQVARAAHQRAQKATAETYARYQSALEVERKAGREVALEEDRRDGLGQRLFIAHPESYQPRRYSYSADGDLARFSQWTGNTSRPHMIEHVEPTQNGYRWGESDERSSHPASRPGSPVISADQSPGALLEERPSGGRKHARVWDGEDIAEAPHKRANHGSLGGTPPL
ncbi:hypothetical protein K488DRAFT_38400, partial [Vararia minispora EC-137]